MDGKTIIEFEEITTVDSGDKLLGVDVSDTSASDGGTNKHFTKGNLLKEYATLEGEETLENKALTSPTINSPSITGGNITDVDITGGSVSATTDVVEVLKKVYPVGCIYTSTVSANPSTLFGFGTWSEYGQGRVLVGKSAEEEFDTIGKTGGAKTHTLTVSQMPQHNHNVIWNTAGTFAGVQLLNGGADAGWKITPTQNTGNSEAHNNLQPYIVVYFWLRED